jgi:hypothetical protein
MISIAEYVTDVMNGAGETGNGNVGHAVAQLVETLRYKS